MKKNENTQLFKHKGDIKAKYLFLQGYVPFSTYSSNVINHMTKYHKEKLEASQSIMKRIESQSILKQLSFVNIPKIGIKMI